MIQANEADYALVVLGTHAGIFMVGLLGLVQVTLEAFDQLQGLAFVLLTSQGQAVGWVRETICISQLPSKHVEQLKKHQDWPAPGYFVRACSQRLNEAWLSWEGCHNRMFSMLMSSSRSGQ